MTDFARVLTAFNEILGVQYQPSERIRAEAERFLRYADQQKNLSRSAVRDLLVADINAKFRLNADGIARFLASAARKKVTFNYHEKREINAAFDSGDASSLRTLLKRRVTADELPSLLTAAEWIAPDETLKVLQRELKSPTLTRKDSKPRDWAPEILEGLFTGLLCNAFGAETLHRFNDPDAGGSEYEPDYWLYLKQRYPSLYSEKPRLAIIKSRADIPRAELLRKIEAAYTKLPEFGHLALLIEGLGGSEWPLVADAVLYAEKHVRRCVDNGFFRKSQIQAATLKCIPTLDVEAAKFEVWNDGFYYLDCFVIDSEPLRLLVLLQKREANETLLPCPSCRSLVVQGNSYSSLGVKSWECCNILCPGKSKFGRGRRYSFVQLLKQAAIEEPGNEVPPPSVRAWLRDVQTDRSDLDVITMLVRHYSLAGDTVAVDGLEDMWTTINERHLKPANFEQGCAAANAILPEHFFESEWFARYDVAGAHVTVDVDPPIIVDDLTAIRGDATAALVAIEQNSVDGAVTSPPYYNAREYSRWDNLYCYLHDMRRVNAAVFRVLKPGAYYLYNIFDYFDNDNTVVLSAMGDRRLALSALTVDLFRRIGFECVGNVVWDKGDIEGKRGFNGGNFSPFYQAPFNCWEHVLIFRKPPARQKSLEFPRILRQGAVIKMIGGKNTHGHSAPFPEAIPALLTSQLPRGAIVLDPFAGSMTTGIAAVRDGCRALCIEKDPDYFDLGVRRFKEAAGELSLF